jgi:hypothetical protein
VKEHGQDISMSTSSVNVQGGDVEGNDEGERPSGAGDTPTIDVEPFSETTTTAGSELKGDIVVTPLLSECSTEDNDAGGGSGSSSTTHDCNADEELGHENNEGEDVCSSQDLNPAAEEDESSDNGDGSCVGGGNQEPSPSPASTNRSSSSEALRDEIDDSAAVDGAALPDAAPSSQGSLFPDAAPSSQTSLFSEAAPSSQGSLYPDAAPSSQGGSAFPHAALRSHRSVVPDAAPSSQGCVYPDAPPSSLSSVEARATGMTRRRPRGRR